MLSNSYTNAKYSANTTSIFVPIQYKPQIDAVIEYQNTQQGSNGEFICAIECAFGFGDDDNDVLLVTVQECAYKRVAKELFDTDTLLALLLDTENPVEDDDVYIKSACKKQNLGNVWFNRDWLLPVPIEVHWAAEEYGQNWQEGNIDLLYIKPIGSQGLYSASYHNTTDDEQLSVSFAVQTKTTNTVEIKMVESSTKGVLTQNW